MRNAILLSFILFSYDIAHSQISFFEDFESYNAGALCEQSTTWFYSPFPRLAADYSKDPPILTNFTPTVSGTRVLYIGPSSHLTTFEEFTFHPFQNQYSTGICHFSTWLYVPNTWTRQAFFSLSDVGNFRFALNGKFIFPGVTVTYPKAQWFEISLEANLNTNDWEVFVDGVSKGHFQGSSGLSPSEIYFTNSVLMSSEFFIDDITYTHIPFNSSPLRNAAVSGISIESPGFAGMNLNTEITVRNLGSTPISSFDISLNANGTFINQSIASVNIAPDSSYTFMLNTPVHVLNQNTFTATIGNVNGIASDDYPGDDTKILNFDLTNPLPDRVLVVEEYNATWEPWSPRNMTMVKQLTEKYKVFDSTLAPISVHLNDPMSVPAYASGMLSHAGEATVMRDGFINNYDDLHSRYLNYISSGSINAKLSNGATYNPVDGTLNVSITTEFLKFTDGSKKLLCVLTEDSVVGNSSLYDQANAYAGGTNGNMGGFENLPDPVPYSQMQYDHVARAVSPNRKGIPSALPNQANPGYKKTINFQFNISNWNKDKLKIIGILVGPDYHIINASKSTIDEAVANGYVLNNKEPVYQVSPVSVYPNPANEHIYVSLQLKQKAVTDLQLIDMQGRIIASKKQDLQSGVNIIPVDIQNIPKGFYIVKVHIEGQNNSVTFIKE